MSVVTYQGAVGCFLSQLSNVNRLVSPGPGEGVKVVVGTRAAI